VQPDFQYVFNPGGGILNPNQPTQRIGNEAIFGLRNSMTF
jgi:porin